MNDSLTDPVEEKRLWLAASKTSFPPRKVERLAVEEQEEKEERAEERSLLARVGYILICWRATGGAWSGAVWADGQVGRMHGCLSRWQPPSLANQVTKPRDPRETRQPEKQEQDTPTESLSRPQWTFITCKISERLKYSTLDNTMTIVTVSAVAFQIIKTSPTVLQLKFIMKQIWALSCFNFELFKHACVQLF